MHRRVKGRPLLLEQVAQVSSSQTLTSFGLHRNTVFFMTRKLFKYNCKKTEK